MRPINKGEAPSKKFKQYKDVEPYLEARIGAYCSYCELPLHHAPEVEHKESKSCGGDLTAWENLLLSCKYCNTRKGAIVAAGEAGNYLWPDQDDTFHVFSYEQSIPRLNEAYLTTQDPVVRQRAENLFKLVQLDHVPGCIKDKDRRNKCRNEAMNCARISKQGLQSMANEEDRRIYREQILLLAKFSGFFSVWMTIFHDDSETMKALIQAFPGTERRFFVEN